MGQSHSRALNPKHYPAIWFSDPEGCSDWEIPEFPFDKKPPKALNVDPTLWNRFGEALNIQLSSINRHLQTLRYSIILVFFVFLIFCLVNPQQQQEQQLPPLSTWYQKIFAVAFLVFAFITFFGDKYIILQNIKADKAIQSICEQYDYEFQQTTGYTIKYSTMHTGFCKPKYTAAQRIIVFIPSTKEDSMTNFRDIDELKI